MLSFKDLQKYNIGSEALNHFIGGTTNYGDACVQCDGTNEYCPTRVCETVDCPEGNDIGGTKAKACKKNDAMPITPGV